MTWKLRLVLLFSKITKPISGEGVDISKLRRKSASASRLGSLLFDQRMDVQQVTDIHDDQTPMRIYHPTDEKGHRVIIYYHGGGFVLYGLDSHDHICRRLSVMNKCVVVSVDYRLAPEHTYPAAHDDAYHAIQWVRKHIHRYGGNPDDIVVAGDSAGGNLAACMAFRCRKHGVKLTAQVLIYPWIDGALSNASITRNGEGYLLTKETMFWFQKQYTPRPEDHCVPGISPRYEKDHSGLAPAFILTAEFDPLIDDGYDYYVQLSDAGTKVRYQEYPGLIHGFFNIPGVDPNGKKAFEDIQAFLKEV